ncbi:class I SAM-dependent methyltransferase [Luteipulveratus sp. YIM 133132]|uniref:Class I SAM-dependent methyltransferase n=1 Tax=Luteipulveratus flavus TaxID=3031728 RepID=A0ABT6C6G0_9MICO|nr:MULTISPECIES: class I SAM-dependent methyltransferase [unclassified Luteipulveratus]MDE9366419.1 class I SAM-dependent methyltransferase [Luteipulveratus sp. YIM 133132]MDF8264306.1 class I SAM-dependent methyltransferase [Luteipulveratus sp. YIM 133296]
MSAPRDWQTQADEWAAEATAAGRPNSWFERLYRAGRDGTVTMPWDRDSAHPVLMDWLAASGPGAGRAAVVGCGLGADAEHLAQRGFDVVAFDLSPAAVAEARRRHPGSPVEYVAADLLDPPDDWREGFDLVVEIYTVQAVPVSMRTAMTSAVSRLVAPGGTLLAVQVVRTPQDTGDGPPWPMSEEEMRAFAAAPGLVLTALDQCERPDRPGTPLWRAEVRRAPSS